MRDIGMSKERVNKGKAGTPLPGQEWRLQEIEKWGLIFWCRLYAVLAQEPSCVVDSSGVCDEALDPFLVLWASECLPGPAWP